MRHTAKHWRRHLAALVRAHRRIELYQNRNRGRIQRRKSHKRRDILRRGITARCRVEFLRRARFSASGIPIEARERTRTAFQHHAFEHLPHRRGGGGLNHAARLGLRIRRRNRFVALPQRRDHMRLHDQSAIGDRRHRGKNLQRRDADLLSH